MTITHVVTWGRGSKYHAQRTTVDGIVFASKAEARHYAELKLLEKAGAIKGLRLQPRFPLCAPVGDNTIEVIGEYVADFSYTVAATGMLKVIDVKGVKTALYRWKKKHFELEYQISITEVGRQGR